MSGAKGPLVYIYGVVDAVPAELGPGLEGERLRAEIEELGS